MKAAIYSRKSRFTGKGESIENQVQFCMDYAHKLGIYEFEIYEDEGYSGGNTNRPQFKKLLKDASDKKFDYLICYRLDRISRNVSDFSTLIETLNKLNISFISIKEQFDTSTPMGRAMMYIASVFSQLERETIAERIKDNMYELARSGRWLGGQTPYGFKSEKVTSFDSNLKERSYYKLMTIDEDIKIVKLIFDKYLELRSMTKLHKYLYKSGILGLRGNVFDRSSLSLILRNPVYVKANEDVLKYLSNEGMDVIGNPNNELGILTYAKNTQKPIATVSKHNGIIDPDKWLEVQRILKSNISKSPRAGTGKIALLSGILKCNKCKKNMRITYKNTLNGEPNSYYYVCGSKKTLGVDYCNCKNLNGKLVENIIIDSIKNANIDSIIDNYNKSKTNINYDKNLLLENIKNIEGDITVKEETVGNLVLELSKNTGTSYYTHIVTKIKELDKEIKDLKEKLNSLNNDTHNFDILNINLDILIDNINKFNTNIDNSSLDERRILLSNIISQIVWDSDSKNITIHYLGVSTTEQFNLDEKFSFRTPRRSYIDVRQSSSTI